MVSGHDEHISVLVVDRDAAFVSSIATLLQQTDSPACSVFHAETLSQAAGMLDDTKFSCLLATLMSEAPKALEGVTYLHTIAPELPIVVLAERKDNGRAVDAIQCGAQEFLHKEDMHPAMLKRVLVYAIERNRTRLELQASHARVFSLIEKNVDGILVVDIEGVVRFLNPAAKALFGCEEEDLLGNMFGYPLGAHKTTEIDIISKNNGTISAEMRVVEIEWSGKPAYLASIRDITERKQMEVELQRLATALEHADEIIEITDTEGVLQYVNPAFTTITGFVPEEVLGGKPSIIKSGKHTDLFYATMWNELKQGEVWRGRLVNKKKDGTLYEEEASISPVKNADGEITNYVAVKRDVTEQERILRQLQQSQKMESIGTLAGGIAHDFNNILSAIIGYTELSLNYLDNREMLENNLKEVIRAGQRARGLTQQILAFSRQSDQEKKPLLISLIVKEVIKLLRATLPTTITITSRVVSNNTVLGDPSQIHQILMNLATNAGHAMSDSGGTLTIVLEDTEMDPECAMQAGAEPGRYVKLTVGDTGYGIEPAVLDRIFDPFFTTKEPGQGTGMGLSVVHGIVKEYGGAVQVTSKPGEGTLFEVYLPALKHAAQQEQAPEDVLQKGREKILFVDDEQSLADLAQKMLTRLGYTVTVCTCPLEALKQFGEDPAAFDLVITDMTMPNMTGDRLACRIKQIRPETPVILCTGFSQHMTPEKATNSGIDALVMKPILQRSLSKTIRDVLDPAA